MSAIYDISSAVYLQRSLVDNLQSDASNGDTNAQRIISTVGTNLGTIANSYADANNAIYPALTYQDQVKTILDRENDRLTERKTAIDRAFDGQRRMISLNDSAVAKQKSYNYILMVVALTLVIYAGLRMLRSYQIVPDTLLDIISIIVVSLGIIYCLYLFTDISHRSKMDFNQITLANPREKPDSSLIDKSGVSSGATLLTPAAGNICAAGTEFNTKYQVCIPLTVPYGTQIAGVTLSNTNYTNFKIFANTTTSPVSFYWGNTTLKCKGDGNTYDGNTLTCTGIETFATITGSMAIPYTPTEYDSYSKY